MGCLVITTVLVYVERDCYRDLDEMGALTWIDAIYYATVTLSTTGYGSAGSWREAFFPAGITNQDGHWQKHREDMWDPNYTDKDGRKNSPEIATQFQQHLLGGIKWACKLK